jgi:hypothetical protein
MKHQITNQDTFNDDIDLTNEEIQLIETSGNPHGIISDISIEIQRRISTTKNKKIKTALKSLLACEKCGEKCNILSSGEKLCINERCMHVDIDGIKYSEEWDSLKLVIYE